MEFQQVLECSICLEILNDPRIIPCFHTFCLTCVQQLQRNTKLTCPLCCAKHDLQNVSTLPKNFIAQNIIDELKNQGQKSSNKSVVPCDSNDSKQATKFCETCDSYLCDECWNISHSVGKLMQHKPQIVNGKKKPNIEKCSFHASYGKDFYCETCVMCICNICWIDEHKEHNVSSIFKYSESKKTLLISDVNQIREKKADLIKKIRKESNQIDSLQAKIKSLQLEVDSSLKRKSDLESKSNLVQPICEMLTVTINQTSDAEMANYETVNQLHKEISKFYFKLYGESLRNESMSSALYPPPSTSIMRTGLAFGNAPGIFQFSGLSPNQFGSNSNQYGSNSNQYGSNSNQYGYNSNQYGAPGSNPSQSEPSYRGGNQQWNENLPGNNMWNNDLSNIFALQQNNNNLQESKYNSRFVRDKQIRDGEEVRPGGRYTKIWVIRNTGELPWPKGTVLVWQSGDKLQTIPERVEVPEALPQQDVDVAVDIIAPTTEANYTAHYRMVLPNGGYFGNRVWADISVKKM